MKDKAYVCCFIVSLFVCFKEENLSISFWQGMGVAEITKVRGID